MSKLTAAERDAFTLLYAEGACRDRVDVDFFPSEGWMTAPAKKVCATCPVRVECLEWALAHENHGVWGGTSERERRTIRRRRGYRHASQPETGLMRPPGDHTDSVNVHAMASIADPDYKHLGVAL